MKSEAYPFTQIMSFLLITITCKPSVALPKHSADGAEVNALQSFAIQARFGFKRRTDFSG